MGNWWRRQAACLFFGHIWGDWWDSKNDFRVCCHCGKQQILRYARFGRDHWETIRPLSDPGDE